MEEKILKSKDLVIESHDSIGECLNDGSDLITVDRKNSVPRGFVNIFEINENGKKNLISKSNLVVYTGREWLLSRAFNLKNVNISQDESEFLCWFGLGSGGAPIGDPLNPTAPTLLDTELSTPIMINASDASCGDWRTTPDTGYYKHPFDAVTFEQDVDNENSWIIVSLSALVGTDDANGFNLSEAGLYTALSDAGAYSGDFHLYARITFPTQVKTSARQILFLWYLYF